MQPNPTRSTLARLRRLLPFVVLASPLLTSCAAMFTGTKDEVRFDLNPAAGTTLYAAGKRYEVTDVPIEIPKKTKEVLISNPEHGDFVVTLNRKFSGGFLLMDILFTPGYGLSGMLIDGGTGAWYRLPSLVSFDLSTATARQTGDEDPNGIVVARADPEKARKIREACTPSEEKGTEEGTVVAASP